MGAYLANRSILVLPMGDEIHPGNLEEVERVMKSGPGRTHSYSSEDSTTGSH